MKYTLQHNIPREIFRAYDIRGIAEKELSENVVFTIGVALGNKAYDQQHKTVVVGRDGRLSGPALSAALVAGLRAAGCDVIDIGRVPTPLLYFATHLFETGTGIMLTGSHNPPQYNGLKIMIGGMSVFGEELAKVHQEIQSQRLIIREEGTYREQDINEKYLQTVVNKIHLSRPLKIVIDCGNGVTGQIAPLLFKALGCEVISLFCEVDGNFPNHHPDPMVPANLKWLMETVKKEKADVGLAFDGDGDRLGVVTEHGDIIWPDRQLLLFAQDILKRQPGAMIIYDVKCTRLLKTFIEEQGGKPVMSATGHSIIKAELKRTGAPLGGEMSGHIFFKEGWYGFDDGLYCGARLLSLISQQALPISQVFEQFPSTITTPEMPIAIEEEKKFALIESLQQHATFPGATLTTIDGIRADYPNGWGLIRASNTTPTLVTRFEADTPEALAKIQEQFKQQIKKLVPNLKLPF